MNDELEFRWERVNRVLRICVRGFFLAATVVLGLHLLARP